MPAEKSDTESTGTTNGADVDSDPSYRSAVLKVQIENFAEMARSGEMKAVRSKVHNIAGLPWFIEVGRAAAVDEKDGEKRLAVLLRCDGDHKDLAWGCSVDVKFRIISSKPTVDNINLDDSRTHFTASCDYYGFTWSFEWILNELKEKNLSDDVVIFAVFVTAEKSRALKEMPKWDSVLVNGELVRVNKYVLAGHSDFFKNLFFGANSVDVPDIGIKEISEPVENFKRMLASMYPENRELDDDYIEAVLTLATRFALDGLENKCVKFLLEESQKLTLFKYRMADKFGYTALKERLLKDLKKEDFAAEKYGDNFREQIDLSTKAFEELMERYNQVFGLEAPNSKKARTG